MSAKVFSLRTMTSKRWRWALASWEVRGISLNRDASSFTSLTSLLIHSHESIKHLTTTPLKARLPLLKHSPTAHPILTYEPCSFRRRKPTWPTSTSIRTRTIHQRPLVTFFFTETSWFADSWWLIGPWVSHTILQYSTALSLILPARYPRDDFIPLNAKFRFKPDVFRRAVWRAFYHWLKAIAHRHLNSLPASMPWLFPPLWSWLSKLFWLRNLGYEFIQDHWRWDMEFTIVHWSNELWDESGFVPSQMSSVLRA